MLNANLFSVSCWREKEPKAGDDGSNRVLLQRRKESYLRGGEKAALSPSSAPPFPLLNPVFGILGHCAIWDIWYLSDVSGWDRSELPHSHLEHEEILPSPGCRNHLLLKYSKKKKKLIKRKFSKIRSKVWLTSINVYSGSISISAKLKGEKKPLRYKWEYEVLISKMHSAIHTILNYSAIGKPVLFCFFFKTWSITQMLVQVCWTRNQEWHRSEKADD